MSQDKMTSGQLGAGLASGVGIRVDVDDAQVRRALDVAAAAGADMTRLHRAIAGHVLLTTQRRFERETGPGGVKWPAFAASTLARMSARRRADPKLLRDSVRLYDSLMPFSDSGSAAVGTNVVYAAIHQFGGDISQAARSQQVHVRDAAVGAATTKDGRRVGSKRRFASAKSRAKSRRTEWVTLPERTIRIPARPYLGIDEVDRAEILRIVADQLDATLTGAA